MLKQVISKLLLNNNEFVWVYYLLMKYFVRNILLDINKVFDHVIQQDGQVLRELLNHLLKDVLKLIDELSNEDELNEFKDVDQHLYIHHMNWNNTTIILIGIFTRTKKKKINNLK
jgi:hypothetical protein